jgi:hypothetical protein
LAFAAFEHRFPRISGQSESHRLPNAWHPVTIKLVDSTRYGSGITPLRCPDIAARQDTAEARHKELLTLMERSGAGIGGRTINTFVYGPDLNNVERELQALHHTAAEKNCPAH